MRDAVELERRGIPTVTVVHDLFESPAHAQARALGLADLKFAVVSRTNAWESPEEVVAKADVLFPTVVGELTKPSEQAARS
ncbi:MAG: hypothetical protein HYX92_11800 [Chloroflexi bacterium]|nr:hypothetical protein [Chloroflexota bacterium]